MIFCNIRTDFNFIFGQFSVARKLILNGGAIRPIGLLFVSSAVPPGSGAFQMPTRPSSSAAAAASTLRGGKANLRNASVTFFPF